MYNLLNSKVVFSKFNSLTKKEKEMGKVFSEKQGLSAIKCNLRFSRCSNYEELAQHYLVKWHFTPYIVAKFSNINSNLWGVRTGGNAVPYGVGVPSSPQLLGRNIQSYLKNHWSLCSSYYRKSYTKY